MFIPVLYIGSRARLKNDMAPDCNKITTIATINPCVSKLCARSLKSLVSGDETNARIFMAIQIAKPIITTCKTAPENVLIE